VAHVQGLVHADVAAVVNLAGVKVPLLDKSLGQHQGRSGGAPRLELTSARALPLLDQHITLKKRVASGATSGVQLRAS
jgi:hypothetical protein